MNPSVKILLAALLLASGARSSSAEVVAPLPVPESPQATFTLSGGVVALGIGYEWARGILTYQGRTFPFRVRGMSVLDLGAAKLVGTGEVFHLKSLADFEGRYTGTTFGSAVSHGASMALMNNANGVSIRARSTVSGVRLNFSGNGFQILFDPPLEPHVRG